MRKSISTMFLLSALFRKVFVAFVIILALYGCYNLYYHFEDEIDSKASELKKQLKNTSSELKQIAEETLH